MRTWRCVWQRLSRALSRRFERRSGLAREAAAVWRGLRAGQAGVETVLGLPHALAAPLLIRHFSGHATPSSASFAATGLNGFWTLPAPHPDVRVRVLGDATGRLVHGEVTSLGCWSGVWLRCHWSPYDERPVWCAEVRSSDAGGGRAACLDALIAYLDASGWRPDAADDRVDQRVPSPASPRPAVSGGGGRDTEALARERVRP